MIPTLILPHEVSETYPLEHLHKIDYQFTDAEATCNCCSNLLTTEIEAINCVCLTCMVEDEKEAKLRSIVDLVFACRHIIHLRNIISEDIRSNYRFDWERAVDQLCSTLRSAQSL